MKVLAKYSKLAFAFFFILHSSFLQAQSGTTGSNLLILSLVGIGLVLLFGAIFTLSDHLLQIEAVKSGVDVEKRNYSLVPRIKEIFSRGLPEYTTGSHVHQLQKGHDIKLVGKAAYVLDENTKASTYAIKPPNFRGLAPIPRVIVEVGDEVLAGEPLFHDKKDDRVKYVAPVSGEIIEIRRGGKRSITEVIILADKSVRYKNFEKLDPNDSPREKMIGSFLESGIWSLINQRPYDLVPDPDIVPENIFISTFDSAPLAPDLEFILAESEGYFQRGLDVLSGLTDGDVHLGLSANGDNPPIAAFAEASNVRKHWFKGPHPCGNVGIQIHHTAPISRTGVVWTLGVQEVVAIGKFVEDGIFDGERIVALTGAEASSPKYIKTYVGANIGDLVKGGLKSEHVRLLAGDVLSGKLVKESGFLNLGDDQITVLKEGDYYEMFGWLLALKPRPSISRTFPGFLFPQFEYEADTNTHGEKRAFVVTGQYESVLPMDIYVQHLMKAIMTGDVERMEGLGIKELTEEDVALCEFACTSKMPLQSILRDGLDMMMEQG